MRSPCRHNKRGLVSGFTRVNIYMACGPKAAFTKKRVPSLTSRKVFAL